MRSAHELQHLARTGRRHRHRCRQETSRRAFPRSRFGSLWLAVAVLVPAPSSAFQIAGRVVNGTTGSPVQSATIRVVNPSGGMMVEREVQIVDELGHFRVNDLDEKTPVYLVRVVHRGVNYTELVQFDGLDPYTVELKVYEPTTSWDGVRVSIPHVMVARSADTLTVEKFIQITNDTSPPKTVYGEDARFVFDLPADLIEINGLRVSSMGIPLPVKPVPTDEPGFYAINYPIKPGVTRVSLSFDVPYGGSEYRYTERFKYDIDEMMIITRDPGMTITSATHELEHVEDPHGFSSYRLAGLGSAAPLSLVIRGGGGASDPPRIFVVQNETYTLSIVLMTVLALALLGLMAAITRRAPARGAERKVLAVERDELLHQLAKLDDLYQTGTVSDQLYRIKRTELMNVLAQIYYRMDFGKRRASRKPRKKKGAARV